jgi:aminoglycoside 3-N-acetyltransferase I
MSKKPPFTVQHLGVADVALLKGLLVMFGDAFDEKETYTGAQPVDDYLRGLLRSEHFIGLTALRDGEIIGGIAAYVLNKSERERSEVYIYDLAVAGPHRRQGVATALIGQLRVVATMRGAHVIFVQADLADQPAIALYTKLGVRKDVLQFDIPVE